MAVRGTVDQGAGGTLVTSISGTTAEITVTPTTGAAVASLPAAITLTGKTLTGGSFVGPALGTPASGVLTNCTALPAAQVVSGALVNGMTATTQAAGDSSTKLATTAFVQSAVPASIPNYISGLTLSTAGSSGTFGVAVGGANDTTNAVCMLLASAYTKTTAGWAVGTGNGGLDTGAIANATWYHVYIIERTDLTVTDILFSLSASAPTMPANYTFKRRIGSMLTNGSAQWTLFTQVGTQFIWAIPVNNLNGSVTLNTPTLQAVTVPTGVFVTVRLRGYYGNSATGTSFLIQSPSETAANPSGVAGNITAQSYATNIGTYGVDVLTNTSAQVRITTADSTATVLLTTYAWYDLRGQ